MASSTVVYVWLAGWSVLFVEGVLVRCWLSPVGQYQVIYGRTRVRRKECRTHTPRRPRRTDVAACETRPYCNAAGTRRGCHCTGVATTAGAYARGYEEICTPKIKSIKSWTGLSVEQSIRMTEDRDKWRKYTSMVWPTLGSRTATPWTYNSYAHNDQEDNPGQENRGLDGVLY